MKYMTGLCSKTSFHCCSLSSRASVARLLSNPRKVVNQIAAVLIAALTAVSPDKK
jgi:hypothetical protein